MIRHIAMQKLNDTANAPDFKAPLHLDTRRQLVPGMHAFEVAIRTPGLEDNCNVVLYSEFENIFETGAKTSAALTAYRNHPYHQLISKQRPGRLARHPNRA